MAYYSLYELYFFNRVGIAVQCSATIFLKIYCAPPNLGITRTLIYRLNFSQWPIFSGLRFFNKPEISELGTPRLKSLENIVRDAGIQLRANTYYKSVQLLAYADDVDIIGRTEADKENIYCIK